MKILTTLNVKTNFFELNKLEFNFLYLDECFANKFLYHSARAELLNDRKLFLCIPLAINI